MSAPQIITDLVERFERNYAAYKSGAYNETQVRREFIDPFFEALGWDVNNVQGYAEAYKDVIHEDAVKIGGVTKAPDYSFRIGGTRKFFVEAKKPSILIKDDPAPAFQVRRYAWSAKLPLSIVTDFEELAVYDCRVKPDQKDKADKARISYYTFRQYLDKWDEIAAVFSRDAILKGSFDKYAESHKAKRGTTEVDSAFLEEIESWRDTLAKNIALRNSLSVRELNEAVQRTIDRIIFLRIAEDRGIEDYGSLRGICNGPNTFARLRELFYKADDRYNSGLFHFRHEKGQAEPPDSLTVSLNIDDKPLKEILKRLYYPDSPYEFAVLPADILGQVYEQFLGKVIRLTSDHRAVVEDKPEVKKAGGVFYTPTYIVDYIVQNTVGKLLNPLKATTPQPPPYKSEGGGAFSSPPVLGGVGGGKPLTAAEASKLRILDPACGSGSFLLGAYQYLLDWHLQWYVSNDPEKWAKTKDPRICTVGAQCLRPGANASVGSNCFDGGDGNEGACHAPLQANYRLTTAERKRILLNNIYGVDIDSQAVEVTKLSLLLKVLEGETGETLNQQMRLFHERALPDLGSNIKCGNSLIGPDFYDGKQMGLLADEEMYRVNVFDWQREFAEVFKAGGFDAVIGNPPYGASFSDNEKKYIQEKYATYKYRYDSYIYFIEQSAKLASNNGYIGFITPELWLKLENCMPLRQFLSNHLGFELLRICGENVFSNAVVNTIVFILRKGITVHTLLIEQGDVAWEITSSTWQSSKTLAVDYRLNPAQTLLIEKIDRSTQPLSSFGESIQGITPYDKYRGQDAELIKSRGFHFDHQVDESCGKWLAGKDITRYRHCWSGEWLRYGSWLAAPRDPRFFEGSRLLFREVPGKGKQIQATLVEETFYHGHSITPFKLHTNNQIDARYLLGLANSKLISWYGGLMLPNFGKDIFPKMNPQDVKALTIRTIDFTNPTDKAAHDRMVQLVEQMLSLQKQLPEAKTGHDQTHLQRQIDTTDRQIDKLVYELYGLTEEEIAVVEGKS